MAGLDDALLESFMDRFYGYGNLDAPYWFIGMEEGGGKDLIEIQRRLAEWHKRGEQVTEDLVNYHQAIDITEHIGPQAKFQKTWAKLVRVLHILEGEPMHNDVLRRTQGTSFGRSNGSSCLLELLPLPSRSANDWPYAEYARLSYLKDRDTYRTTLIPKRLPKLRALIQQHRPRSVLFYGLRYCEHWQKISGQVFEETQIEAFKTFFARSTDTLFVVTPHPVAKGITNDYFNQIGELMRERIL